MAKKEKAYKDKTNIEKNLDILSKVRKPTAKKGGAMKDKDAKKEKRGDRGLKYKKQYDKDSE